MNRVLKARMWLQCACHRNTPKVNDSGVRVDGHIFLMEHMNFWHWENAVGCWNDPKAINYYPANPRLVRKEHGMLSWCLVVYECQGWKGGFEGYVPWETRFGICPRLGWPIFDRDSGSRNCWLPRVHLSWVRMLSRNGMTIHCHCFPNPSI